MEHTTFVGLDVHKRATSVAIAEPGRGGEVRFLGEIPSTPEALHRLVERLQRSHGRLGFCYEAGPCGYGVHRLLSALGQDCSVVAPSLIPSRPGDRVKTNRRDATTLAKLHRAGEATPAPAGLSPAPRPDLPRRGGLAQGIPPLADHGPLRPSRPADRPPGLHPCGRGCRSAARAPGAPDRGAPAGLVDGAGGRSG